MKPIYLLLITAGMLLFACTPPAAETTKPPVSTEGQAQEKPEVEASQVEWVPEGHSIVKVRVVESTGEVEIVGDPITSGVQTHYYDAGYYAGPFPGYGYCPWVIDVSGDPGFVDLDNCVDPNDPFAGMSPAEVESLCTPPTDWVPVGGDVIMSDEVTGEINGIIAVQENGTAIFLQGDEGYVLFPGQGITITDVKGKTIEFYLDCKGQLWKPKDQESVEPPQLPIPPNDSSG